MDASAENQEIIALIELLDEPDPAVFDRIRDKLLEFSGRAIPQLEQAWENTFDPLIQERIETIIHQIQFNDLTFDLQNWKLLNAQDLLKGYLLVCRLQYPEINEEYLISQVEQLKWDIWLELNDNLTALEKINVVNHVFYEMHKFGANKHHLNALQNYFLNNLLESHRGNMLSLGILYLVLCQKLGLPVYGVELADQIILAYTNEIVQDGEVLHKDKNEVLFYINPFKKGGVFTRQQAEQYLAQSQLEMKEHYLMPCEPIVLIKRLIINLSGAYQSYQMTEKVKELQLLKDILDS